MSILSYDCTLDSIPFGRLVRAQKSVSPFATKQHNGGRSSLLSTASDDGRANDDQMNRGATQASNFFQYPTN